MGFPFLLLRTPDLMQRWDNQHCIRIVLEQKILLSKTAPRVRCAPRATYFTFFHEHITRVTRSPSIISKQCTPEVHRLF